MDDVLDTERKSLHISDGTKKTAFIETLTVENGTEVTTLQDVVRYQYDNHLGTSSLELDENAATISYEEYHPFGTSSYRLHKNDAEASLKRYRYVGKERDGETGLYYYGARYYAAHIARFISVDPLQHKYPHKTPYDYAENRPIVGIDLDGLELVLTVTGDWWNDRINSYIENDDRKSALAAAFSGLSKTTEDVKEWATINGKNPEKSAAEAKEDWGGDHPVTASIDINHPPGITVINSDGEEIFSLKPVKAKTIIKEEIEKNGQSGEGWLSKLDNLVGDGGYVFTWDLGQGQETRKGVGRQVDIGFLFSVLSGAKGTAGAYLGQNIFETLNNALGLFNTGGDLVDAYNELSDALKSNKKSSSNTFAISDKSGKVDEVKVTGNYSVKCKDGYLRDSANNWVDTDDTVAYPPIGEIFPSGYSQGKPSDYDIERNKNSTSIPILKSINN